MPVIAAHDGQPPAGQRLDPADEELLTRAHPDLLRAGALVCAALVAADLYTASAWILSSPTFPLARVVEAAAHCTAHARQHRQPYLAMACNRLLVAAAATHQDDRIEALQGVEDALAAHAAITATNNAAGRPAGGADFDARR